MHQLCMHYAVLVDDNKAEEFSPDTQQSYAGRDRGASVDVRFCQWRTKGNEIHCPWSGIRDYASVADDFSSASGL